MHELWTLNCLSNERREAYLSIHVHLIKKIYDYDSKKLHWIPVSFILGHTVQYTHVHVGTCTCTCTYCSFNILHLLQRYLYVHNISFLLKSFITVSWKCVIHCIDLYFVTFNWSWILCNNDICIYIFHGKSPLGLQPVNSLYLVPIMSN